MGFRHHFLILGVDILWVLWGERYCGVRGLLGLSLTAIFFDAIIDILFFDCDY